MRGALVRGVKVTLDREIVDEVKRLLAEGRLSQRKIAAKTRVSRGSVLRIATGRRPEDLEGLPDESAEESPAAVSGTFRGGLPVRCKGCGRLVHLPIGADRCLVCVVRGVTDVRPPIADTIEPLGVDLVGEELQRYRELLRYKQEEAADPKDPIFVRNRGIDLG